MQHTTQTPSPWMIEHAALVPTGATLLDVACGYGRHAKFFAARGVKVTAVDRDEAAIASLRGIENLVAELRDIEGDEVSAGAWPYGENAFDAVVVCNYLWRPTFARMLSTIKTGGVLLYETFMVGNERYGKPSRAEFLLQSNELLAHTREHFRVIAYREGEWFDADRNVVAMKASIAAVRIS
jgi:SAM-dependent methyltransferase